MKFSVITPTRNAIDKLKRCVGSVRGQTGVAIEHIIQDACSTDGTPDWLAAQPDVLARSEPDAGMYDAINRGWGRASGDIFSWLNSDEQYLPGTLEKVAGVFERNPDVDLIYGDALVVDATGNLLAARREIRLSRTYIANSFLNAFHAPRFFDAACSMRAYCRSIPATVMRRTWISCCACSSVGRTIARWTNT